MTEQNLADYIRRVVDEAPPLSAAQRDRLAAILRPVADLGALRVTDGQTPAPGSAGPSRVNLDAPAMTGTRAALARNAS